MITFKVKNNGDWDFATTLIDIDAVIQTIYCSVNLEKKSAFWDEENGVDYINFRGLTVQDIDVIKLLKSRIIDQIKKVPYVKNVQDNNLIDFQDNNLTITMQVFITINNNNYIKDLQFTI